MNSSLSYLTWSSLKGVSEFMRTHFKRYFFSILTFTLVSSIISILLGIIPALLLYSGFGHQTSSFEFGFYFHINGTSRYLGVIFASLLAMLIRADINSDQDSKFSVIKGMKSLGARGWMPFLAMFIFVFLVNVILYKDIFNVGFSVSGFQDLSLNDSEFKKALYTWINSIVTLLKNLLPYVLAGLAYLLWRVSSFTSCWKLFLKNILCMLILCVVLNSFFSIVVWEVNSLLLSPLHLIFKAKIFVTLFGWLVYLPVFTFFMLTFSAIFIASTEEHPEVKPLNSADEELLFPA